MLRIVNNEVKPKDRIINMADMKPLQVGVIVDTGQYVMRTAHCDKFEVMRLFEPGIDCCWNEYCRLKVRLLNKGEKITIELFNEE